MYGVNSTDFGDFFLKLVNFEKGDFPKDDDSSVTLRFISFGVGNTSSYSEVGSSTPSSPVVDNSIFDDSLLDTYLVFDMTVESVSNAGFVVTNQKYGVELELKSSNYKNYSIFSYPVNSSDIAVSENPIQIAENILDETGIDYIQSQSSESQTLTSSYNFQCYFGEREELQGILSEFAEISKTYMWIGDSGSLNMRTYQNSSAVSVDNTINLNHILNALILLKYCCF